MQATSERSQNMFQVSMRPCSIGKRRTHMCRTGLTCRHLSWRLAGGGEVGLAPLWWQRILSQVLQRRRELRRKMKLISLAGRPKSLLMARTMQERGIMAGKGEKIHLLSIDRQLKTVITRNER